MESPCRATNSLDGDETFGSKERGGVISCQLSSHRLSTRELKSRDNLSNQAFVSDACARSTRILIHSLHPDKPKVVVSPARARCQCHVRVSDLSVSSLSCQTHHASSQFQDAHDKQRWSRLSILAVLYIWNETILLTPNPSTTRKNERGKMDFGH